MGGGGYLHKCFVLAVVVVCLCAFVIFFVCYMFGSRHVACDCTFRWRPLFQCYVCWFGFVEGRGLFVLTSGLAAGIFSV